MVREPLRPSCWPCSAAKPSQAKGRPAGLHQPHSTDSSPFIRRLQLCRVPHKGHDLFHTPERGLIIQDRTQGPYSKCLKESPLIWPKTPQL